MDNKNYLTSERILEIQKDKDRGLAHLADQIIEINTALKNPRNPIDWYSCWRVYKTVEGRFVLGVFDALIAADTKDEQLQEIKNVIDSIPFFGFHPINYLIDVGKNRMELKEKFESMKKNQLRFYRKAS